jgi:hypothetical protein
MVNSFLKNLSQRLNSENNLSDITWALCQTSPLFKISFLKFIFGNNKIDFTKPFDLFREYSETNTDRPDFYFQCEQEEYIIEVKIYDRKYHFDQYKNAFPNAYFGFIANYELEPRDDIFIKTWESFYKYIKGIIDYTGNDTAEVQLIEGYLIYLKEVCDIMEIKKLNFSNLSSLYYFNHLIEKIINSENNCEAYSRMSSRSSDDYSGKYFLFTSKNSNNIVYPWFGIFHNESAENMSIVFENYDNYCKLFIDKYKKKNIQDGEYYKKPYMDGDGFFFVLHEKYYNELCNDNITVEQKIIIIKSFFKEVVKEIRLTLD